MSDLPAEAVQAAALALEEAWGSAMRITETQAEFERALAIAAAEAAAPFIAEQARTEERARIAEHAREIAADSPWGHMNLRKFIARHARLVSGDSPVAVLLALADEIESPDREAFPRVAGERSTPVPVQVAPNATESAPHPLPGVPGSLNAPERISAPRNVPVSDMTEAQRMTLAYNAANAMRGVHKRRADNLRTELDHAQAALAGDNEAVQAFMADHEAKAARLREGSAMWQREAEKAEAAIDRVHAEHAAIHAEMDDYAKRHNRACECEVIPTTRETADRMLAALSVPAPPKETPNG